MPEKYLIIPALCSYAYSTHYAQNYASIIRKTLTVGSRVEELQVLALNIFKSVVVHGIILSPSGCPERETSWQTIGVGLWIMMIGALIR